MQLTHCTRAPCMLPADTTFSILLANAKLPFILQWCCLAAGTNHCTCHSCFCSKQDQYCSCRKSSSSSDSFTHASSCNVNHASAGVVVSRQPGNYDWHKSRRSYWHKTCLCQWGIRVCRCPSSLNSTIDSIAPDETLNKLTAASQPPALSQA